MTEQEIYFMVINFGLKMLAACAAIGALGLCGLVGAYFCGINIKEAVDRVEKNPLAYAIFVTGHFIGAALVISAAW